MPTLRQLRYFLTIADLGGFTQAAGALFVAQPALSRQIALLEEEWGFRLFERTAHGLRLTPPGLLLRERVGNIDKLLLAATEEAAQVARGEAGVLRLLHSSSVPVASFIPAIKRFVATAPRARIELDRVSSEVQISEIAAGNADIGIVRLPVLRRDPAVQVVELGSERLWVALPEDHPLGRQKKLTLKQLSEESFVSAIHRERGGLARLVTDLCLRAGYVPKLAPTISRKTSMLDLVASGFGVAVVPHAMTHLPTRRIIFRPLKDAEAVSAVALVRPQKPSSLAMRFEELLRAVP
jgi:DNA-binding transcriptional LysR family regulator